jgi:uncharacterized protein
MECPLPPRLRRLEWAALRGGGRALVAEEPLARLLGLAGLEAIPSDCALLIPRCRSVHTFGMRFAIDIDFLDRDGRLVRCAKAVGPGRIVWCRAAAAVVERPAG